MAISHREQDNPERLHTAEYHSRPIVALQKPWQFEMRLGLDTTRNSVGYDTYVPTRCARACPGVLFYLDGMPFALPCARYEFEYVLSPIVQRTMSDGHDPYTLSPEPQPADYQTRAK